MVNWKQSKWPSNNEWVLTCGVAYLSKFLRGWGRMEKPHKKDRQILEQAKPEFKFVTFVCFVILSIPDGTSGVEGISFTCLRRSVACVPRRGCTELLQSALFCPRLWSRCRCVQGRLHHTQRDIELDQKTGNLMSFHGAIHQSRRISKIVWIKKNIN